MRMWQEYTTAVLGLIVIGVAFLGLESTTLTWTLVVLGALIAGVGAWGAVAPSPGRQSEELHA